MASVRVVTELTYDLTNPWSSVEIRYLLALSGFTLLCLMIKKGLRKDKIRKTDKVGIDWEHTARRVATCGHLPKELQNQPRRSNLTNLMSFESIDGLPRSQFENRRYCVALAKIIFWCLDLNVTIERYLLVAWAFYNAWRCHLDSVLFLEYDLNST